MDERTADQKMLRKCISGDPKAREAFVHQFSDLIYKWIQFTLSARRTPFSRQDLEDLHNTIFLKLFENRCKKLRQYRGENGCSVFSWIRLVTIRMVTDYIRSIRKDVMSRSDTDDVLQYIPDLTAGEHRRLQLMEQAEQAHLLNKALRGLSSRDHLFLKLHCIHGLSITRVAGILKVTENNAYSIKHRAISRLKKNVLKMADR